MDGGSDLQPLMPDELSFVEEIMSGKFSFLSVKEALGEALGKKKGENKRKLMLIDTSMVNDRLATGSSAPAGSTDPSLKVF